MLFIYRSRGLLELVIAQVSLSVGGDGGTFLLGIRVALGLGVGVLSKSSLKGIILS